jgi:anthranilate synthase/aminodeoxychorismate synthase-like glutamine amidotransferase
LKEISNFVSLKILLLDNYDSFTYMLKDYIEQCGAICIVRRNDDLDLISEISDADALVVSPGPQTPNEAGQLMHVLYQFNQVKPILGVCLGHQGIGLTFGAKLVMAQLPKHGKIDLVKHYGHSLFNDIPTTFSATRYHSLILEQLPADLEIIAVSPTNEIIGIAHKSLPLWGIQFHPESCTTEFGLQLIENFLKLAHQNA